MTAGCWADPAELELVSNQPVPEEFVKLTKCINFNEDSEDESPPPPPQDDKPGRPGELEAEIQSTEAHPLFEYFYNNVYDKGSLADGEFFGDHEDDLLKFQDFLKKR